MKQIPWSKYWADAFVFNDSYVLDLSDDAMTISQFDPGDLTKPDVAEASIRKCPKIDLEAFGKHTLRGLIKLGQFSVTLTGPKIGVVKHNDNYSVCADGAYWRKIRSVTMAGELTKVDLALSITLSADPVETLVESQPPGSLSDTDRTSFVFSCKFIIPTDGVPELIDMDRTERRRFRTLVASMKP